MYGPLLQLARKVLGSSTSLILSSEWDYSPYTFFGIYSLRNFILIGLPAPESANPLLLPLAGHELGHAIWNLKLKEETRKQLQDAVEQAALSELHKNWSTYADKFPVAHIEDVGTDIECFHVLAAASQLSLRQCEESFCDFVGLRIFGTAYLYAFGYLLAGYRTERVAYFPNMRRRSNDLVTAAESFGYKVPNDYSNLFMDDLPCPEPPLLPLIDVATESVTPQLIQSADSLVKSAGITKPSPEHVEKIKQRFKEYIVPLNDQESLPCIINAAWDVYLEKDLWKKRKYIKDRDALLKDLVLKSIEVLQIRGILDKPRYQQKKKQQGKTNVLKKNGQVEAEESDS